MTVAPRLVRLLHNTGELGQLVQEEHTMMGERHLSRPRNVAATDQCHARARMVRAAERALLPAFGVERACEKINFLQTGVIP